VLKFEQKHGTSLVKLVLSFRKSGLRTESLPVPVILGEYRAWIHSEPAECVCRIYVRLVLDRCCSLFETGMIVLLESVVSESVITITSISKSRSRARTLLYFRSLRIW
jgi:hypothetical protein